MKKLNQRGNSDVKAAAITVPLVILLTVAAIAFSPFLLMVILGALSHLFDVPKLALSFWQTLIVYAALGMIGGLFKSTKL